MTLDLEFITPAFLCGADQGKAEIRAASIRGELRWWFRVLGATAAEEREVFGGVHGEPTASRVVTRVANVQARHEEFPRSTPMSDFAYLYYFASVSGETKGIRIQRDAYFAPGTRFTFELTERRTLADGSRERLSAAVHAFVRLGALGLRTTRGCGAVADLGNMLSRDEFVRWAETLRPHVICKPMSDDVFDTWRPCQEALGGWLRQFRKEHHINGKTDRSALGYSLGKDRHASALRLRPVRVKEGIAPLLVYTDAACKETSLAHLL